MGFLSELVCGKLKFLRLLSVFYLCLSATRRRRIRDEHRRSGSIIPWSQYKKRVECKNTGRALFFFIVAVVLRRAPPVLRVPAGGHNN